MTAQLTDLVPESELTPTVPSHAKPKNRTWIVTAALSFAAAGLIALVLILVFGGSHGVTASSVLTSDGYTVAETLPSSDYNGLVSSAALGVNASGDEELVMIEVPSAEQNALNSDLAEASHDAGAYGSIDGEVVRITGTPATMTVFASNFQAITAGA